MLRTLEEPLRQIAENAGVEGSIVVSKVREMKPGEGFNAATGEYTDLVKAGVIDPTMVTRSALQNAASIAKNILTTECVVAEIPEKEPDGHARRWDAGHDVRTAVRGSQYAEGPGLCRALFVGVRSRA